MLKTIHSTNYSIECYRIIATLIICAHHFYPLHYTYNNPAVVVEFFFFMSGYFLMMSFKREKQHKILCFAKKRFFRLYPEYIAAYALLLLWNILKLKTVIDIKWVFAEITLLNKTVFEVSGYNYPGWYVCTLFWAEIILYVVIKYLRRTHVWKLMPVLVVIGYVYLFFKGNGSLEVWNRMFPLLRAVCGLLVGVFIYEMQNRGIWKKMRLKTGTLIECISLCVILYGILKNAAVWWVAMIGFVLLIFVTVQKKGLLSSKLLDIKPFKIIGRYSYGMYLNQALLISAVWYVFDTNTGRNAWIAYYIGVFVVSVIIWHVIHCRLPRKTVKPDQ